jgi:PAS domain S-box-containing protein
MFEAALLLLCLVVATQAVFGGLLPTHVQDYPLDFLCIPMLVWAAFRFGPRETATAAFVLSTLALWGTLRGLGPFVRGTQNESLLLLQIFMGVTSVMALAFAALVAERQRAEATRRALFESASEGVLLIDWTGRIILVNAAAERMFDYGRGELLGQTLEILLPERVRGPHVVHRTGYFAEPRVRPMGIGLALSGRRNDGTEFPVEISLSYVRSPDGVMAMAFITDITERSRVEEAARRTEALDSVALLANAAAHEINNPLTAVMLYLQILETELEAAPAAVARLRLALGAGEKIQKIVARMQHITAVHVADQPPNLPQMLDLEKSSTDPE